MMIGMQLSTCVGGYFDHVELLEFRISLGHYILEETPRFAFYDENYATESRRGEVEEDYKEETLETKTYLHNLD